MHENPAAFPESRRVRQIHFVGIGGAGMCGIAELFHNRGYQISGSDLECSATVRRLQRLGIKIVIGHGAENLGAAEIVVRSSAITDDNVELAAARKRRVPVLARAEMLSALMRSYHTVAVAGTHGKTTTTSLIASILAAAGYDPTFVIGGLANSAGAHARLGASRWLTVEADESDASFLHLQPTTAVITGVDRDHLRAYGGDFVRLQEAFVSFLHNLPFYGLAVMCRDDPWLCELMPRVQRLMLSYGLESDADFRIHDMRQEGVRMHFSVTRPAPWGVLEELELRMPGAYNVLNAVAAVAVASEAGVEDEAIRAGLIHFQGVRRRFEVHENLSLPVPGVILVDDYGHHPTEIRVTLEALRTGWPGRRIVMVYQPHRYTRTRDLGAEFVEALAVPEVLVLLDIYGAGEEPLPGVDGASLFKGVRKRRSGESFFLADPQDAPPLLHSLLREGDILLIQGAGDISHLAQRMGVPAAQEEFA